MEASRIGEGFLRQAAFLTNTPHIVTEGFGHVVHEAGALRACVQTVYTL